MNIIQEAMALKITMREAAKAFATSDNIRGTIEIIVKVIFQIL